MGSVTLPFPQRLQRDVLEIRRYGSTWTVVLIRPSGMPPVSLADCENLAKAEQFAHHVASVRGATDVRRGFSA